MNNPTDWGGPSMIDFICTSSILCSDVHTCICSLEPSVDYESPHCIWDWRWHVSQGNEIFFAKKKKNYHCFISGVYEKRKAVEYIYLILKEAEHRI